jgi:ParB-like chromosome segregation protein Spo0J
MFHPPGDGGNSPYQLLPSLSAAEYKALKADIAARGVLVPIERDEQGRTLDGHHRERICHELGVSGFPVITRTGLSEQAKVEHVLKVNLLRRHLGPLAWAEAYRRLLAARGVELGQGRRNDRRGATSDTASEVALELGIDPRTARRRLRLADELSSHPDLAAKVDAGEIETKRALTLAREREARSRPAPPPNRLPAEADLRLGDFREVLADLENGTVDLIHTDPPWLGASMPIFADLAAFAARVLKPTGILLCEVGQLYLAEAIRLIGEHLSYRWCVSIYLPGQNVRVQAAQAINSWRPLLVYSPTTERRRAWLFDSYRSEDRPDKTWHPWQKSVAAASYYIEQLTQPGDLVVDPFLGSSTAAIAAVSLGRMFVGCDVDPDALHAARVRLAEAAP